MPATAALCPAPPPHPHPDAYSAGLIEASLDDFFAWLDAGGEPHLYRWGGDDDAPAAA